MNTVIMFAFFICCLCVSSVRSEDNLEKKYANFDVEKVLQSKRLVNNYVNCMVDKGPCTKEASDLKKTIPTVLETVCANCSEEGKKKALYVIKRLKTDYPEEWKTLLSKWDPKGEYYKKFTDKFGEA